MADSTLTVLTLLAETRRINLSQTTPSPGSAIISWTLPKVLNAVDGLIILISPAPFDASQTPVEGQRYIAGTDLSSFTGNKIGQAFVIFSQSKVLGQTLTDGSVTVTGLDPTENWYVSAFGVSNVFQYSSSPIYAYLLEEDEGNSLPHTFAGSIPQAPLAPSNPTLGQVYYDLQTGLVNMWSGTSWISTSTDPIQTGSSTEIPLSPIQGQFYYNTTVKALFIFDGSTWTRADTAENDGPMVEKIGVGTDGSYDERARLIDVLKIQLGSPTVCIEVGEEAFDVAIDNALDEFRRRADNAYTQGYVIFDVKQGQQKYYLNDPRNGSNKIVNIIKVHRLNTLGMNAYSENNVYAQMVLNQFYQSGSFDILSIHLLASVAEDYQRIFAGDFAFIWDEPSRQLHILRSINKNERVLIEASLERTEQELLTDRWAKQWLQHWAHSELLEQLGIIRSKFGTLPGAGGGITLNGSELLALSAEMQTEALRQISDFEAGNGGVNFQNCAFLIG